MCDMDQPNLEKGKFDKDEYKAFLSQTFPSSYMKRNAETALKQRTNKRKKGDVLEQMSGNTQQTITVTAIYSDDDDDEEYVPPVTTNKAKPRTTGVRGQSHETVFKKMMSCEGSNDNMKYFKTLDKSSQGSFVNKLVSVRDHSISTRPYLFEIMDNDSIPLEYKSIVYNKIMALNSMEPGNSEYSKTKCWIDNFARIPFGVYKDVSMNITDGHEKCTEYMRDACKILDDVAYGMEDAKYQFMQLLGKWVTNPGAKASAIAIKGPMGTGKTTLVKDGISKILGREFALIALGGASDGSYLDGHSYTYEGSIYGKIVDILIQTKSMNPVIFMDELDKVSASPKGDEIVGILTHLTDPSQNTKFNDKYFSELDIDISRCLFIFSYNDESLVNPILLDRMYKVETSGYSSKEKQIISQRYLIPGALKEYMFPLQDVIITDEAMSSIITDYTGNEKGVRNLKRCIETIMADLNLHKIMGQQTIFNKPERKVEFPFTLTRDNLRLFIKGKGDKDSSHSHMYM